MLSARTATTATEIAMMPGCWDARASRNPETASRATPQPVAAAPAATASSSLPRSGRAMASSRSSGRPPRAAAGRAGQPGGVLDVRPEGAGPAQGDVVGHRSAEQPWMLRDPGDLGTPGVDRDSGQVGSADAGGSGGRLGEPQQQPQQRGLSRPARP